jgi:polar amino acid transport system substrate-binding protein
MTAVAPFILPAGAVAATPLRFVFASFPPFAFSDSQGPAGSLIELLRRVADTLNWTWTAEEHPQQRVRVLLAQGRADIGFGVPMPVYPGAVLHGSEPVMQLTLRAFTIGNGPGVRSLADLKGQQVILRRGYTYGGIRSQLEKSAGDIDIVDAADLEQGLRLLRFGRGTVLLEYAHLLRQGGAEGLKEAVLERRPIYFLVSRSNPNADLLLNQFQTAYLALLNQGRLSDLNLGA